MSRPRWLSGDRELVSQSKGCWFESYGGLSKILRVNMGNTHWVSNTYEPRAATVKS